ncbi:ADP-ribosyltransferase [Acrocarpospora sp. B8E8]|uniref:ADP-ribosyltransferase n=1 Tax=Acrocarpospora sp. B8E8 TaxID=3153572 RepID=UPI00325E60D9
MPDYPSRRPYPGQDWRHGWEPVTAGAHVSKNHGRKPAPGTEAAQRAAVSEKADAAIRSMANRKRPGSAPSRRDAKSAPAPTGPSNAAPDAQSGAALRHRTNREAVSWAKKNMPLPDLTDDERDAVSRYTGRGYGLVNDGLRGKPPAHPKQRQLYNETVRDLDSAMKKSKTPEPVVVHRDVGDAYIQALGADIENLAEMKSLVGKRFQERGYLSTSVGARSSNMRGSVDLAIVVPKGYPALNLTQASGFASDERELLLGRGAKYVVRDVRKGKGGRWSMEIEILPPGRGK